MQFHDICRRTRFTASVMVFIWLFVLGAGIANGCLMHKDYAQQGHLGQQDVASASISTTAAALDTTHGDHASVKVRHDTDGHDTSSGKIACENFFAAEQAGVSKKQNHAPAHLDDAHVLVSTSWVAPLSADRTFSMPVYGAPPWSGPPVFIRFLRLTL